jgi:diguanylate cyclase (GGDEF)-like protein
MIFNILVIEDKSCIDKVCSHIDTIENSSILSITNSKDINDVLKNNSIHCIIIAEKFIGDCECDLSDIPVFVISKDITVIDKHSNKFLFDIIDFEDGLSYAINKINFCRTVYQKELQHEEEIKKLLYVDNLTKKPNRTKLIQDLQNDDFGINSLAIIDINSFKEINDFFGHRIGDVILKGVSEIIERVVDNTKGAVGFYKFPSDTYCLANINMSKDEFKDMVAKTIQLIDEKVFIVEQHEIDTRATAGITFSEKNNKLVTADLALQAAKKDHKDYLIFYDELDNLQEYQNNMIWTKKLKQALERDDIIVYFQPLVNNKTKKVDKYECLVRMLDGEKIISPFFFLEVSKKANQYSKITQIVIEKSFKEFENLDFEFSVNVSYEDIEDGTFLEFVKEKLELYNVAPRVVWEILEDEGIKNYDVLLNFIDEVKALGCKVAIDDFGSGYSNFEHLLKMKADYLKIDASLIKNIATDENSYQVVKTIMEFSKSLDIKTIAEFVENEDIFNIVTELGATYSQGYFFAPPIPKPNLYKF